jgi:hypothetical protein
MRTYRYHLAMSCVVEWRRPSAYRRNLSGVSIALRRFVLLCNKQGTYRRRFPMDDDDDGVGVEVGGFWLWLLRKIGVIVN